MYFLVAWVAKLVIRTFFREITVLGTEKLPNFGPVIFISNHNNQFVDACMMIGLLPRRVRFLIAEKSFNFPVVGMLAKLMGCIGVKRPSDSKLQCEGRVTWDSEDDVVLKGFGTSFKAQISEKDRIEIAGKTYSISSVDSDSVLTLATCISKASPEAPLVFSKFLPVDNSEAFLSVSERLKKGTAIGIFPEGGSHDRPELLPLKPGVGYMSLQAAAAGATDVMVVPIGINYFQGHKMMSKAVVEIGTPIHVTDSYVKAFQEDKRETVKKLLCEVDKGLRECVVCAPNYEALRNIRLCVSLYPPERMALNQQVYFHIYHLMSQMFLEYQDEEYLRTLNEELSDYAKMLKQNGIRDYEVWWLKQSHEGALASLVDAVALFLVSFVIGLSFIPFWSPIGLIAKLLAEKNRKKAMQVSEVKLRGHDVLASYKIVVMMILVPTFNLFYGALIGFYFFNSWRMRVLCSIIAVGFFPIGFYFSTRNIARIFPLIRQIRTLTNNLITKWQFKLDETDNIRLIRKRAEIQQKLRDFVQNYGRREVKKNLDSIIPPILIESDSKRVQKSLYGEYAPMFFDPVLMDTSEEIL